MRLADAAIDIAIDELQLIDTQKTKAVFNVELIEAKEKYPQVYSRAMAQTLEAIIHATRVKALSEDLTQRKKVNHLLEMIDDCNKVVNRVAPNSPYSLVMADLIKRIDLWRRQK